MTFTPDGWWSGACRMSAHPGRVGGTIKPYATVVHTTDTPPGAMPAIVKSWTTMPGAGDCAHFMIGRDALVGVVQFVSVWHNSNHSGGPGHGVFDSAAGMGVHPNSVSIGIEIDCAGDVRFIAGQWRLVERGMPYGNAISAGEVVADPLRLNRGWHTVTDYQLATLGAILDELEIAVLEPMPAGLVARSTVEIPPVYATFKTGRVVGHASLDPQHRGDPWKPTFEWLHDREDTKP